jgi:hypothetical protein
MTKNNTIEFLLKEYDRISEAHFNTSNQISIFFRYYLTLMSVPALLLLYINKDITTVESVFNSSIHFPLKEHIGWLCLIISLIRLALTIFLTKLKFEHILYARTVNGIRNFFHTQDENLKPFLVLPVNIKKPSFVGFGFGSLVFVNGLVNSSYLSIGLFLLNTHCYILSGFLYLAFHIYGYLFLNRAEENKLIQLQ